MAVRSLNKVMLIGNLTRDPELRYTPAGTAVCSFGLATNRAWKDANNEMKEAADFHNIVAWAKMAEICNQILAKGMKVYVEGSLSTRSWNDDKGTTHYRTEIRINDLILLDSKGRSGYGNGESASEVASEGSSGAASSKSAEELLEELSNEDEAAADEAPAGKKSGGKSAKKKDEDPLEDMPF